MDTEIISILRNIEIKLGFQKEVFNMDDFCAYSGFSKSYVYRLTSSGSLRYYRPAGKQIFFDAEDVKSFLKQNPVSATKEIDKQSQKFL